MADVNGDGTLSGIDANLILQYFSGQKVDLVGEDYYEQVIHFYPVVSDNVHGINLNDSANVVESEDLVRGTWLCLLLLMIEFRFLQRHLYVLKNRKI